MNSPRIGRRLSRKHLKVFRTLAKDSRGMILDMVTRAQSGHPGGALSSLDILTVLYAGIVAQTGEKLVVSNGHVSPAVYATLAQLGLVQKDDVIEGFRANGSDFEGHVARLVPGILYGSGPLGIGLSVASGMAWAEKNPVGKKTGPVRKVFAVMGDGESQEGEVYEMMNYAGHNKLDNLIVICDDNGVQLTDSVHNIVNNNIAGHFEAAGWKVLYTNGHDYARLWTAIGKAYKTKGQPVLILAKTVMGKGVNFMEKEGLAKRATWHGKAPSVEEVEGVRKRFNLSKRETNLLEEFRKSVKWKPGKPQLKWPTKSFVRVGKSRLYAADELTDCRSAYGQTLLDLVKSNSNVVAMTSDLRGSVKTGLVADEVPEKHIECGIAEQHMMSMAGGLSFSGYIPFVSTFAVFMSSRAKGQARLNDVNNTNVKMVSTHSGVSNGPDGPTHHALDDSGAFLGFLNTKLIEPADPNQTDRIIRYVAANNGNYYVRLGRQKLPVVTDLAGKPFYNLKYSYRYGRTDLIRKGRGVTVVAIGATVNEAILAWEKMNSMKKPFDLVAVTSIKKFDKILQESLKRNNKVLTVEDHNLNSGLHSQIAMFAAEKGITLKHFGGLGIKKYMTSGTVEELYESAGINSKSVIKYLCKIS
jgi:transketolase